MDDKLITMKPCGILHIGIDMFYLMQPKPLPKLEWQDEGSYRFLVTPIIPIACEKKGRENYYDVYGYLRHVITTSFAIEYLYDAEEIKIQVLANHDLTEMEMSYAKEEPTDYPF